MPHILTLVEQVDPTFTDESHPGWDSSRVILVEPSGAAQDAMWSYKRRYAQVRADAEQY
jgi:hypothetical protein